MPVQQKPRNGLSVEKADAVPPQDIAAEQAVLGAMLIEQTPEAPAIEKALALLSPSSFTRPDHQAIYAAAIALHGRGEPVDLVTLPSELKDVAEFDAAGGMLYLTSLFETVPTSANVEHYAKIVADKAALRQAHEQFQRLANATLTPGADLTTILKQAETQLGRIAEQSPAARAGKPRRKPLAERMIDLADVQPPSELPLMFGQYLLKGEAHWLTGQTGLGKSTLLFNIACALAEGTPLWGIECEPQRVLYADMESGDVGRALKIKRLYRDAPRVRGGLIFVREPLRLPDELSALLEYVQQNEINLVIFDTARRVFSVKDENDNAEFYNRITPTLDALKLAGVASLTLGHPSKNGNGSARGAGAQEDAGDVNLSLTMHRGEVGDKEAIIALRVTKNRLLGLGIPPLLLKRIGNDRFEPIAIDDAGSASDTVGETPKKGVLCAEGILMLLSDAPGPIKHAEIVRQMEARGYSNGTAKHTISRLQKDGIIENYEKGYILAAEEE